MQLLIRLDEAKVPERPSELVRELGLLLADVRKNVPESDHVDEEVVRRARVTVKQGQPSAVGLTEHLAGFVERPERVSAMQDDVGRDIRFL